MARYLCKVRGARYDEERCSSCTMGRFRWVAIPPSLTLPRKGGGNWLPLPRQRGYCSLPLDGGGWGGGDEPRSGELTYSHVSSGLGSSDGCHCREPMEEDDWQAYRAY